MYSLLSKLSKVEEMKTNLWHSGGVWLLSIWFMGALKSSHILMDVAWILALVFHRTISHVLHPSNLLVVMMPHCQVYCWQAMRRHCCCNCSTWKQARRFVALTHTEKTLLRMKI